MQGDNKHPHINKSGSFSRLRSFKLNDMGFSLNKISPITFDVKNPQTPADCGIKGRALTSTPRERRAPQAHNEEADLNEAHHKPQGNASYNPDESITNKHIQGRFIPPKAGNMSTQPQQQQQSLSKEGSKENTILNGPRHQRGGSAQDHPSGPAGSEPQGSAPTAPSSQAGGPPQAPPVNNSNKNHQIHQNAMQPPTDPPKHLQMAKAQDLPKQRIKQENLTLKLHQVQVLLHSLLILRPLLYVQHVAKVATGAEIVLIVISVTFVE